MYGAQYDNINMTTQTSYVEESTTQIFDKLDVHQFLLKRGFSDYKDQYIDGIGMMERQYTKKVDEGHGLEVAMSMVGDSPVLDIKAVISNRKEVKPGMIVQIWGIYSDQFDNCIKLPSACPL